MNDFVYVVGIVAVVAMVITAIVYGRGFRGKAGPGGGEIELAPNEDTPASGARRAGAKQPSRRQRE